MKILIDLDQTILQTSKTLIANWNKLNPNNKLEYKEPIEWDFTSILSGTNISLKQLCSTFDYKYFYEEAVLFNDCLEVINKWIEKGYEVIILTKHDMSRRPITKEFIDKLFDNKVKIEFVDSFEIKNTYEADVIIDDKIESLINSKCKTRIEFGDNVWSEDAEGIIRCYNWKQVEYCIDFIAE